MIEYLSLILQCITVIILQNNLVVNIITLICRERRFFHRFSLRDEPIADDFEMGSLIICRLIHSPCGLTRYYDWLPFSHEYESADVNVWRSQ